jgi:hypothetical protein
VLARCRAAKSLSSAAPLPDTIQAVMATPGRIYRRTEAGRKAWDTQNSSVPLELRRVLGIITTDMHSDEIRVRLGRYSEEGLRELLTELEHQGLLESEPEAAEQDLDFTTELNLADVVAAANRKPD